jgi:hypothetical protein
MRRPVRPEPAGLGQRLRVTLVRLHASAPLRVHRRVVRIGHYHLVAQLLQEPRHPLADRRGLYQDLGLRPILEKRHEPVTLRPHPLLDQLPSLREDGDLAFLLPKVHANMFHGG